MNKEAVANSIMKGLYHVAIGNTYLQDVVRSSSFDAKHLFAGYINKLEYVVKDIKGRLSETNKKVFEDEIQKGDTIFFDAIAEKCAHLSIEQRDIIEAIIDEVLSGEKINAELA